MNADIVVVDSSVFVAVFKDEPDSTILIERAMSFKRRVTSAATWFESIMVCEGASKKEGGGLRFERIVAALGTEITPFTPEQARLAFDAFKRFGKGRGTKASLNFGDCFAYALAKELQAPLLYRGNDFAHTDLQPA
ncbi:MAG: type II toxin-antitoxin system VapC family toxin [Xanthobacteraceae bacterium]